jgi:hypothetical protein
LQQRCCGGDEEQFNTRFKEKPVTSVAGFSFGDGLVETNYRNISKYIKNNENIEN